MKHLEGTTHKSNCPWFHPHGSLWPGRMTISTVSLLYCTAISTLQSLFIYIKTTKMSTWSFIYLFDKRLCTLLPKSARINISVVQCTICTWLWTEASAKRMQCDVCRQRRSLRYSSGRPNHTFKFKNRMKMSTSADSSDVSGHDDPGNHC